ncbi:hypothetical protein, partial [Flavonifractor plautii]
NPPAEDLGGKNSVKENRQGCLSRPGRPLFEPFLKVQKVRRPVEKIFSTGRGPPKAAPAGVK